MTDVILRKALVRLKQVEKYDRYFAYLSNEWLQSKEDLLLAVKDEQVWSDLKLPARLKLEIKNVIEEEEVAVVPEASGGDEQEWVLYYSEEHGAYYYYHTATGESQWAESESYEEDPTNGYNVAEYEQALAEEASIPSPAKEERIFSRPKSTKSSRQSSSQISQQRVFFPEDHDDDEYDDDYEDSRYDSSKVAKKPTHHRELASKDPSNAKKKIGRKRSSQSHNNLASSSKYASSSSSSSSSSNEDDDDDHSSVSSTDSQYYIISESKKQNGKLKIETYSMPKHASPTTSTKSPGTSQPPKRIDSSGKFTNKVREQDVLETKQSNRFVEPSAPPSPSDANTNVIDYDAFLQQYRKTTKVMGASNPEAATPILTKRVSRRDSYMGRDNLRDLQDGNTPRSARNKYSSMDGDNEDEDFVIHPTPYVDHTDVYKSLDEHEDIVYGANDMLLDLAMGMENGLDSIPGLSSHGMSQKMHAGDSGTTSRNSLTSIGVNSNPLKQALPPKHSLPEKKGPPKSPPARGPPPAKPASHGGFSGLFHKKAPIPLGLPNHIDALPNRQAISPKSLISSETQHEQNVKTLMSMGFTERASRFALEVSEGDIEEARSMLLDSQGGGKDSPVPVAQAIPSPVKPPVDYYDQEGEEILAEPLESEEELSKPDKDKKSKKKGIQRMGIFRLFN